MGNYSELPVYKASYDLVLEVFRMVKDFDKNYKHTIGEKLKNETIELVLMIYRANCRREKKEILISAREKLEVIRLVIRITKDLHQINTKKLVLLNKRIENVSKQLTGWEKSVTK